MAGARVPWWREAVFYQIYPRSFQDSNGDGIGDLPGIIARLDHLNGAAESLGVDAIWLTPFYPSPNRDFGYDVSDYCDVHPEYGTLADFDRLLEEAHARGIKVIVDFVPNHTSDQHPWFRESRASRTSARRDWYVWADPRPDGSKEAAPGKGSARRRRHLSPPNNWRSTFGGVGSAWTLDPATGQYYLHHFLPEQPDLNWWNPAVRAAMDEVLRFWLDRGVDGFRVDVAHGIVKDPELRDNPRVRAGARARLRDWDHPGVHEIFRSWRRSLDGYSDRMAVGEVYLLEPPRVARYLAPGELDLAFNFHFLHQPWRAERFRAAVAVAEREFRASWPCYTLSNHDHPRHATRYDDGRNGAARARLAAVLLLTLRGTPFLYCGEEIGLRNVEIPKWRWQDPFGRDGERTPMQWGDAANAGFSRGTPWLPVTKDYRRVNVARQREDPASLLALYRRLIALRKASPALRLGSYRAIARTPPGVFAYLREGDGERCLVALNFWSRRRELRLARLGPGRVTLSTDSGRQARETGLDALELAPNEGVVIRLA